ncbi:class I SAM-dependent methyltransferase [Dyadobacter sp. CY323]|uniref:class I SAM-dependent methyltransferase n=1 Tax=Dyadobacter sp. CY323 TaxID=2907302 RepID=UPI001F2E1A02|nr:class I SAM-dependent methyltransferase [Dyadobacter sp. CY323]MCE6989082.1 class I SAM-dependent methyltransferase [Dyadobacter sp. CY323]
MSNQTIVEALISDSVLKNKICATQINTTVSAYDEMYVQGAEKHYFQTGLSALINISAALQLSGRTPEEIKSVLDFPCGYGRVLRFTKALFKNATFSACGLEQRYLDFCAEHFNADTFLSEHKFSQTNILRKFDLIWVGSLFTHLSSVRFKELYKFLTAHLNDNGLLVFTVHGRNCYGKVQKGSKRKLIIDFGYTLTGYGYCHQHGTKKFGDSLISPAWLHHFIEQETSGKIVMWSEQGWGDWQDVIAVTNKSPVSYLL